MEHLPDAAITKLQEIELILEPYTPKYRIWDIVGKFNMTRDYSILDNAIMNYRVQVQKYGTRGSY
jgi:hypothetical protein